MQPRGDGHSHSGQKGQKLSLPISGAPCCNQMSIGCPVALDNVKAALQKLNENLLILKGVLATLKIF